MIKKLAALLAAALFCFSDHSVLYAQQPHHPQINVGHKGIGQLKKDLTYLLSLTSKEDQEQLPNLIDFIDLLAFGLDEGRPIRVDIHSGNTPPTQMVWAPYLDFPDLLDNVQSNFTTKKSQADLYEILPPDKGWFRRLAQIKYAILVLTNPGDHQLLKQLILKAINPLPPIEPLVSNGANFGIRLTNPAQTKEDEEKRRASFGEIRAVRLDALQKRPTETSTELEIRKGITATLLDELERLMVESSDSSARFLLDMAKNAASIEFEGTGIPESSFAEALKLFGKHKDAFTGIKKPQNSVFSLRLNHPIDELRKKNSNLIIDLLLADMEARLAATNELSSDEKEATRKFSTEIMQITRDGIDTGNVNAFAEVIQDKQGELVAWGAMSIKDGERLNETLARIAKSGEGNTIDQAVATVGDVTIHRISFREGYVRIIDKLFGTEQDLYVGVSSNLVWGASGPGALEQLKSAISSMKEPEESDVIWRVDAHLLPWAKRANALLKGLAMPDTTEEKQLRRSALLRMSQAVEAFESDDEVSFDVKVEGGTMSGTIGLRLGVLRFIGMQIATFSRETLAG